MFEKKGLEIGYLRCARSFGDLIACVRKFMDSILNCFEGEMSWLSLGGLEKNTWYFKGEIRKEDKKEEYS